MKPKTVLMISEDRITGTILDCALSSDGYRTEQIQDAGRARERAASGGFEIAIIDLETTGIDGYDLCREIKTGTQAYVIVMSAPMISGELVQLLEADYYLSKPVRVDMLLNIMDELSGQREFNCI